MSKILIPHSHIGLLYENGAFREVLPPGRYKIGKSFFHRRDREINILDTREQSLTIKGQEILTGDKVAIRVSLLVYYRVVDPQAAMHNVVSYQDRIYEDVQLSARRFLATRKLDDILRDRNEISDTVREEVKNTAATYGVRVVRADVKDLVFPGNLREMMNQVLEAERQAEAELIRVKKEIETGRLRNEAHLSETLSQLKVEEEEAHAITQNPSLYRLRKLKILSEMAKNGGKFVVGLGATDLEDVLQPDNK